jgi:hypothetical protein
MVCCNSLDGTIADLNLEAADDGVQFGRHALQILCT